MSLKDVLILFNEENCLSCSARVNIRLTRARIYWFPLMSSYFNLESGTMDVHVVELLR